MKENKFTLKNNFKLLYIVPSLVVLLLFSINFITYGIFPFGKNTFASYDMLYQVTPFYEHIKSFLNGEASLFFTFQLAGGLDTFGTLVYFALSPFSFVFLLFDSGDIHLAVGIVLMIKCAITAFTSFVFLKRTFGNLSNYILILMSVLYVYSGYLYIANTYINWMDFMIYMPLLLLGFKHFVTKGQIRYFVIMLAVMIITCFSLMCFSLMLIFPTCIFYAVVCIDKKNRKDFISKMCLAFVVAVVVCLPLLVPSFLAYSQSGRNTGLFTNVLTKNLFLNRLYSKFSFIMCDGIFLILTILYFVKTKTKCESYKALLFAFIITTIPLVVDESMLLLNFGSYASYSHRFGFLNSFLYFYISGVYLNNLFSVDKNSVVIKLEKNKTNFKLLSLSCLFSLMLVGLFFTILFKILKPLWLKGFSDLDNFTRFSHSIGAMEFTAIIFILLLILFCATAKAIRNGKITINRALAILSVFLISQTVFYSFALTEGNVNEAKETYVDIANLLEVSKENYLNDDIKVKTYDYYVSSDAGLMLGYQSMAGFTSVMDKKNITQTQFFKYFYNGYNNVRSMNGTAFSDFILGYDAIIVSKEQEKELDKQFYSSCLAGDLYVIYHNKYVSPSAVKVNSCDLNFDLNNYDNGIKKVYNFLSSNSISIDSSFYDDGEFNEKAISLLNEHLYSQAVDITCHKNTISTSKFTADKGEFLFLSYAQIDGWQAYVNNKKVDLVDNSLNIMIIPLVEGQNIVELKYTSPHIFRFFVMLVVSLFLLLIITLCYKKFTFIFDVFKGLICKASIFISSVIILFYFIFPIILFLGKILLHLIGVF